LILQFYRHDEFISAPLRFNKILKQVQDDGAIFVFFINIMLKNKAAAFISVFCFFIAGTLLVQFREDPKVFSRQQEYTSSMSSFSGNINLGPVSAVQK